MEGQREIEVKYRVDDLALLETALRRHRLVLSAGVEQDDQAYAPVGWRFGMSKVGVPFARLRTEGSRHLFTVKVPVENSMSCLEYETELADREQMDRAIVAMGFYPTVRIRKTRRSAWSGQLRICVDDVESVGSFLELERVVDLEEPGMDVQAALDRFARSLEVPMERATQTYDSLVRAATSADVGDSVLAAG